MEEHQNDHGQEEGSHHGDSQMSKHREEECEHEHSHTPPSGRRHHQGGQDCEGEDSIHLDIMKYLWQSKPPFYDGKGGGLRDET